MPIPSLLPGPRKLERELDNRRIGGVCSGIARYLGISVTPIRLIFLLSIFFSFSFTFWLYLVLWAVLPARRSPAAGLSWRLRRQARRLDRLIDATRERLSLPESRLQMEQVQQLIHSLLPQFDQVPRTRDPELAAMRQGALGQLPKLLDQYVRLPHGYAIGHRLEHGRTPEQDLTGELAQLEENLRRAAEQGYRAQFANTAESLDALDGPTKDDSSVLLQRLEALQHQAAGRLDAGTEEKIGNIKSSLVAALTRLQQSAEPTDPNLYNVRQIALEYLPDALEKFLALPPEWADSEPLQQGKTAHDVLHEQLDILDTSLRRLLTSLYQDDAQGLLVHGRFLRDKFVDHHIEWMK